MKLTRYMLARGCRAEEVAKMAEGLEGDGFVRSALVPEGWRLKKTDNQVIFLSPKFETIKSVKQMLDFMMKNEYSETDMKMVKRNFLTKKPPMDTTLDENEPSLTKDSKIKNPKTLKKGKWSDDDRNGTAVPAWMENLNLPAGWRVKMDRICSPEGYIFASQTALHNALKFMLETGAPAEDIEQMKSELVRTGGWRTLDHLPPGWMTKTLKSWTKDGKSSWTKHYYLSPKFHHFTGRESAIVAMREGGASEEEVRAALGKRWRQDPHLPAGWMASERSFAAGGGSITSYMNMEGKHFENLGQILRHMVANHHKDEDKAMVMKQFLAQGWQHRAGLPEGWFARTSGGKTHFLTPEFIPFKSPDKAVVHMNKVKTPEHIIRDFKEAFSQATKKKSVESNESAETTDVEDSEELKNFREMYSAISKKRPLVIDESVESEVEEVNSDEDCLPSVPEGMDVDDLTNQSTEVEQDVDEKRNTNKKIKLNTNEQSTKLMRDVGVLEEDGSLPAGWSVRRFGGPGDVVVTSVEERRFFSRLAALEWVAGREGREEEAATLWRGLGREGWREEEGLPGGWRAKYCPLVGEHVLVSRQGRVVHGGREVEVVVEGEEREQLLTWARDKGPGREVVGWKEAEGLPEGWRVSSGGEGLVQDSRGVVVGSRVEGVRMMVREHYAPYSIFTMWASLGEEGWEVSAMLPTGWRVRGSTFLSPLMEETSSACSLLHLLEESSEYTVEEVEAVRRGLGGSWSST